MSGSMYLSKVLLATNMLRQRSQSVLPSQLASPCRRAKCMGYNQSAVCIVVPSCMYSDPAANQCTFSMQKAWCNQGSFLWNTRMYDLDLCCEGNSDRSAHHESTMSPLHARSGEGRI
eukprot:365998-Chlamydomonas_euryale.AAC.5